MFVILRAVAGSTQNPGVETGYGHRKFVGALHATFTIFADEDVRVPRDVEW